MSSSFLSRFWLRFSSFVTLTACFYVLLVFYTVSINLKSSLMFWGDEIQLTAYFSDEIDTAEKTMLSDKIEKISGVVGIKYVDQKKALSDFSVQVANLQLGSIDTSDLQQMMPESLQIQIDESFKNSKNIKHITEQISAYKGIDEVRYGQNWVEQYSNLFAIFNKAFLCIGIVILMAVFFVVSNITRAAIETRRSEIEILEMLGATPFFVRKPFYLEATLMASIGGVLALALTALSVSGLNQLTNGNLYQTIPTLKFISPLSAVMFFIIFLILGFFASWVSLRRVNTGFSSARGIN